MITLLNEIEAELEGCLTLEKVHSWMRFAKLVEDSENPCYSRKIGVVIVDPISGDLVSVGHNGPPRDCPPCDDPEYLKNVVFPNLTDDEQALAFNRMRQTQNRNSQHWFSEHYGNCKTCPRRIVNAPSGKRLELCTCAHAEHNAIVQAHRSVVGCWIICHCGIPCIECCKTIVNAGIKKVVCLKRDSDYSPHSSRWILEKADVKVILLDAS